MFEVHNESNLFLVMFAGWMAGGVCGLIVSSVLSMFGGTTKEFMEPVSFKD